MSGRGRRGGGRGALIGKKRRTPAQVAAARAAQIARRGILPSPSSKAGSRGILRMKLPATAEVDFIRRSALAEALAGDLAGPYSKELTQLRRRTYSAARGAQRGKRPRSKAARIRVKAHTRRRPS